MSFQERQFGLPQQNHDAALGFVEAALGTDEFELTPFDSQGFKSQVWACDATAGAYILRHSYDKMGMAKDQYAADHFASDELPIPRVLGVRVLGDKSALCLSERVAGDILDKEALGTPGTALNVNFARALRAIHRTDISDTSGSGYATGKGRGVIPEWLAGAGLQRTGTRLYWGRLAAKYADIDKSSFRDILALHHSLGRFCTTERMLCHGDLKADNLLATPDNAITGVIDWSRFEYTDPAHDLGILYMRYPQAIDIEAHAQAIGLRQDHLRERVLCYSLGESMIALGFLGQEGNSGDKVAEVRQRMLTVAEEAASL